MVGDADDSQVGDDEVLPGDQKTRRSNNVVLSENQEELPCSPEQYFVPDERYGYTVPVEVLSTLVSRAQSVIRCAMDELESSAQEPLNLGAIYQGCDLLAAVEGYLEQIESVLQRIEAGRQGHRLGEQRLSYLRGPVLSDCRLHLVSGVAGRRDKREPYTGNGLM